MRVSFCGAPEFNILYFNDVHSKPKNVRSFKTAVDVFDKENKDKLNFKIAGGDICMDRSLASNSLILRLMNIIGLDVSSIGNHDLEGGDYWAQAIKSVKPKFKFISSNLVFTKSNPVEPLIAKSLILKRKGERVGVIGVSPLDTKEVIFSAPYNNYMDILDFEKTLISVRREVKKLEEKGINKIFLLAHTGKSSKEGIEYYEKLAQIGGIDIIFGGHDHREFDLWYSSERGEPVKLVSVGKADDKNIAGEDLDSFGVLKAVFDEKGVLQPTECDNKIFITDEFEPSKEVADLEEEYLHSGKVIGYTDKDLTCTNRMVEENPLADLTADATLWLVNKKTKGKKAQIALINASTLRGDLQKGDITVGMIRQALPFSNGIIKTEVTKQELFDALNWAVKSTSFVKIAPGIMQVGGLRYTVGRNNKVKDVYLLNEDGTLGEKLDYQPYDEKYTAVYDEFLLTGAVGLTSLRRDPQSKAVEHFPHSRQEALIEYLIEEFNNKPVKFVEERINFEESKVEDNCNFEPIIV